MKNIAFRDGKKRKHRGKYKVFSNREDQSPMKSSERNFARRIDLTSLQLFVAVCELGSIGRAAEREFIAPNCLNFQKRERLALIQCGLVWCLRSNLNYL